MRFSIQSPWKHLQHLCSPEGPLSGTQGPACLGKCMGCPRGQTPGKRGSEKLLSTYWPPKSCIPKSAKTTMNRKRRNSRLMMDFMELRRETTRFLRDAQYLPTEARGGMGHQAGPGQWPPSPPSQCVPLPNPQVPPHISKDLLCDFENTQ